MLTAHLLTHNNAPTVRKAVECCRRLGANTILAGDLGSEDDTRAICRAEGVVLVDVRGLRRDQARNALLEGSSRGGCFWVEPWEEFIRGDLRGYGGSHGSVRILQNGMLTTDVRLWEGNVKFVNPVYERLDLTEAPPTGVVLAAGPRPDLVETAAAVVRWAEEQPLSPRPHYYRACTALALGRAEEFFASADRYLFLDRSESMAVVMIRYYHALATVMYRRLVKPALQNLNLCLCARPLMAEFWCLTGDVYYHLLRRFADARAFYENAMLLGARRRADDPWPMVIDRYRQYPAMMMEACDRVASSTVAYAANCSRT